jgi:hypothetical protein
VTDVALEAKTPKPFKVGIGETAYMNKRASWEPSPIFHGFQVTA